MAYIVDVLPARYIPRPHRGVFSYRSGKKIAPGALVRVPLGPRKTEGIVISCKKKKGRGKLREVDSVLTAWPFFEKPQREFILWASLATVTSPGTILHRMLPVWRKTHPPPKRLTRAQKNEAAAKSSTKKDRKVYAPFEKRLETYARIIDHALKKDGQVLLLTPTQNQRAAWEKRLSENLPSHRITAFTGGNTKSARKLWLDIHKGNPLCIIGTLASLSLPFTGLTAVILDDDASPFWKEDRERPYLEGVSAAATLAGLCHARLIRGGLLPPLDTPRTPKATLPSPTSSITRVNLNDHRPKAAFLADPTRTVLEETLKQTERPRVLFFVNRKGSATSLVCRDCEYVVGCKSCSAPPAVIAKRDLPKEKQKDIDSEYLLRCRHCGTSYIPPLVCPSCRGLKLKPRGVAIIRTASMLEKIVGVNVLIQKFDRDHITSKKKEEKLLNALQSHDGPAVLVATAMVFHTPLPPLDLIVVPSFEQLLAVPDIRAEEEAFRTLSQLHAMLQPKGTMAIQAWHAAHPLLEAFTQNNFSLFAKKELSLRKKFALPPYRRLARLTFRHKNLEQCESAAEELTAHLRKSTANLPKTLSLEVSDPFPAFIERVKGEHIRRALLKWKPKDESDFRVERFLWDNTPSSWEIDARPRGIL